MVHSFSDGVPFLGEPDPQPSANPSPEDSLKAKVAYMSYISLREEGRTQVSLDSILARADLFMRLSATLPAVLSQGHSEVQLLCDFVNSSPTANPIEQQYEVVQVLAAGVRRLGVRVPAPAQDPSATRPGLQDVLIAPTVRSDSEADWRLLADLAAQAASRARSRQVALPSPRKAGGPNSPASCGQPQQDGTSALACDGLSDAVSPGGFDADFIYPQHRLGRAVKRNMEKADSLLATLLDQKWRSCLSDTKLRGVLRAIAGNHIELLEGESPALVQKNQDAQDRVSALLRLTSAIRSLDKSRESKSFLKCLPPLEELSDFAIAIFGPTRRLDSELVVIQVSRQLRESLVPRPFSNIH